MSNQTLPTRTGPARKTSSRSLLSNREAHVKRNDLFEKEKQRQWKLVSCVEKIEVKYHGHPRDCTLIMNKEISTPFHCAMHVGELLMKRSALALVDGKPWDMHRPLTSACQLSFLHFKEENPMLANSAFWRTCSFMLGYVLETVFKDDVHIQLCSFPKPDVRSGSFVYDVDLGSKWNWKPSRTELDVLGREGYRLYFKDLRFERLEVDGRLAEHMFADNRHKLSQVPAIAAKSPSGFTVPVYRMGDHVDLTSGPLISSTGLLGRFAVTAVYHISSDSYGRLTRFQGTAFPIQLWPYVTSWTFEKVISKSAKKFNPAPIPELIMPGPRPESVSSPTAT